MNEKVALLAAGLCVLAALMLAWQGRKLRKSLGLPVGRVIYMDMEHSRPLEQPLYDPQLGLVGKPDYLIENGDQIIPVEVKSTQGIRAPHDAHIFQLAAYCLLVHHHFGKRPAYGILHYPNRTYAINYTENLENALLELIEQMHQQEKRKELHRSHENPSRCKGCGYHGACEERLL